MGLPPLGYNKTIQNSSQLPAIRGSTAPEKVRGASRESVSRVKGLDGKPLTSHGGVRGLTLHDYAKGSEWGSGVPYSRDGFNDASTQANSRQKTAPCWRKPKQ